MTWGDVDLTKVRTDIRAELFAYVENGREPASIALVAILSNDLGGFLEYCQTEDVAAAYAIIAALEHAPNECWGSQGKVSRWIKGGGLRGQIRADARLQ